MDPQNREGESTPTSASVLAIFGVVAIVGMVALVFGTAIWYTARAETPNTPDRPDPVEPGTTTVDRAELRASLMESYRKAADWLVTRQGETGAWQVKDNDSPAYTGLALSALAHGPTEMKASYQASVDRAFAYLVDAQNDDGSFSEAGGAMKTYATGVVLMALAIDKTKYMDQIEKAQNWIKESQTRVGLPTGGSGYGDVGYTKRPDGEGFERQVKKENLSTTAFAAMGMHDSGLPIDDPYWELVAEYAGKNQNSSETNNNEDVVKMLKEAGYEVGNNGGFVYSILTSKAASSTEEPHVLRSYGSMTYAGLKMYVYAGLTKSDPAVASAMRWIKRNFSVKHHPGFEFDRADRADLQGLYYYYLMMARCLDAYGENPLELEDGKTVDWPVALAQALLERQQDATWTNENPRWWENDPVMVTSYVLGIYNILLNYVR